MKRSLLIVLVLITSSAYAQVDTSKKSYTAAITFSSYAEVYYLYNFNNPLNNSQPSFIYSFNRSNEFNLNLGYIKANYSSEKVRGNIALMTGTYPQVNLSAEPEVLRNLFEGNIGVKLFAKKNLWLDAGIFASHIGFESAIGKDCWNLTRSMLAENSPYYESGVKLGYTTGNEKWYLSALLLNGWQRIKRQDGNSTPAFGTQVTYKPNINLTINSSTFIGSDKPDSIRKMRYFHNFYTIFKLSEKWGATIGFDAGMEEKTKRSSKMNTWYSPVLIIKFAANNKVSIAARAEYYRDKNGVIIFSGTPNGFQTTGISANLDYAIQPNVLWRIEARSLQSKDKVFEKRNSMPVSESTWLATSLSVSF